MKRLRLFSLVCSSGSFSGLSRAQCACSGELRGSDWTPSGLSLWLFRLRALLLCSIWLLRSGMVPGQRLFRFRPVVPRSPRLSWLGQSPL